MNAAGTAVAEISKSLNSNSSPAKIPRPVLLLTINNGAGHTRAAEAIAAAWRLINREIPARIVEVSAFMSPVARFTHVSLYLWLVKNAPRVWEKIDDYQKRQTQTSPEWFYRRECRRLFELVKEIQPVAIVATEVGCGEIAALMKRDFRLKIPLAAVNVNYDADRAWIQPETDFYCLASDSAAADLEFFGARRGQIAAWGVPMQAEFATDFDRMEERRKVDEWLDLNSDAPLILVAGGGEGMGKIEAIVKQLLAMKNPAAIVVLAGKNEKLQRNCERLARDAKNLRVLGWTLRVPQLFHAADILISKLGNTFDEARACALPLIALLPPPGSERVQYQLLEKWETGCAVQTVEEAAQTVEKLLKNPRELTRMRENARAFGQTDAAEKLAQWLAGEIEKRDE